MLDLLFSQSFVASLEHSYLFEESWRLLREWPSCSGCIDSDLADDIRRDLDQMRRLTPSNLTEREIERMLGVDAGTAEQYFPKTQRMAHFASVQHPLAETSSLPEPSADNSEAASRSCNVPIMPARTCSNSDAETENNRMAHDGYGSHPKEVRASFTVQSRRVMLAICVCPLACVAVR